MLVTPSKVIQPQMDVGDMGVLGDFRDFGGIYREHCLCLRSFVARLALLMSSRKVDIIAISSHEFGAAGMGVVRF